jgi:hypothetical protein
MAEAVTCSHCQRAVTAPNVFWHPWTGYIHRSCWTAMLDE